MAKADFSKNSEADQAKAFPANGDPFSFWFDEYADLWAVNDENGDAIANVYCYENAVKMASALANSKRFSLENYDIASEKIQKLNAMINAITGEGFENFKVMNDDDQQWYLQAISDFSMEAKAATIAKTDALIERA